MKDNTFVYLWRSILGTSFYKKPLTCHLAIHLILCAAWKDHKTMIGGKEVLIKRGQIPTGRNKLSKETGLSPQNIRTCLSHLTTCGFLTIKSTKQLSIITICKYDSYQPTESKQQPSYQPSINQASTKHQPLQNKGNKGNKNNNIILPLKNGENFTVEASQIEEWSSIYSDIDVFYQLNKCKEWNISNPSKRKTKSGIRRHITTWLGSAQDKMIEKLKNDQPKMPKISKAGDMSIYDN